VVAALAVGLAGAACSSQMVTSVGGCGIQPGSVCHGTYMYKGHLAFANLYGADLARADLRRAVLASAVLTGARLRHTDLRGADLRHAHLEDADLAGADLRGARLDDAWLRGATFIGARGVSVAELERGIVCRTVLTAGSYLNDDC
jgi:hypothetical protein